MGNSPVPAAADTHPGCKRPPRSLTAAALSVLAGAVQVCRKEIQRCTEIPFGERALQMSFVTSVPLPLERGAEAQCGAATPHLFNRFLDGSLQAWIQRSLSQQRKTVHAFPRPGAHTDTRVTQNSEGALFSRFFRAPPLPGHPWISRKRQGCRTLQGQRGCLPPFFFGKCLLTPYSWYS